MQRACRKFLLFGLFVLLASSPATVVFTQDDDEPTAAPKAPPEPTLDDSPLLKQPETQEEDFDAVLMMVKLARPKLAKLYLAKVLAPKPTDELLLRLHDRHGPAVFLQLSNMQELRPLSTQLLDLVTDVFRRRGIDQQRIVALIADLNGTATKREAALTALQNVGPLAVPQLLLQFEQIDNARQHAILLLTLTRMGRQIVPALLGTLESPNDDIRAVGIEALGWLRAREAIPYLWYPAFGSQQTAGVQSAARAALARILSTPDKKIGTVSSFGVANQLKQIALTHYRNNYRWQVEEDGTVPLWTWLPPAATVGVQRLSPQAASLYVGMRFARQTLALTPDDTETQALYLAFALAADRHRVGWDKPLPTGPGTTHDLALTLGDEVVSKTLAQSLENGRADVAIATLQVLSQTATRHQITERQPGRAPIITALNYPDLRVQFAAAATVLQVDPNEPFRSSGRIVSILTQALTDDGAPAALIVHTNAEKSRGLGAFLGQIGFDSHIALTGQGGFRVASERSDISLILLEINTIRWGLSQTIGNLRADARTAGIPIVIFGPNGKQADIAGLLDRHSRLTYIVTPATSEAMKAQVEPFLETFKAPKLTSQQRSARRQSAAYWLAHIASGHRNQVFNVALAENALLSALNDPDLADNALVALSSVSTKTVQKQFAILAMNKNADVRLRENAALQLAFHILRFGATLDERDVLAIRASWASAADPALSTALASVLGSLKPDAKRVGQRLGRFPAPPIFAPPISAPVQPSPYGS
jgi:DNA-binding response OmpR family regulator/HEAT repeat protein